MPPIQNGHALSYLSEKVDFEARGFAGPGLPVVQVVPHRQHELQGETPVRDWPVASSTYIVPSPSGLETYK